MKHSQTYDVMKNLWALKYQDSMKSFLKVLNDLILSYLALHGDEWSANAQIPKLF